MKPEGSFSFYVWPISFHERNFPHIHLCVNVCYSPTSIFCELSTHVIIIIITTPDRYSITFPDQRTHTRGASTVSLGAKRTKKKKKNDVASRCVCYLFSKTTNNSVWMLNNKRGKHKHKHNRWAPQQKQWRGEKRYSIEKSRWLLLAREKILYWKVSCLVVVAPSPLPSCRPIKIGKNLAQEVLSVQVFSTYLLSSISDKNLNIFAFQNGRKWNT